MERATVYCKHTKYYHWSRCTANIEPWTSSFESSTPYFIDPSESISDISIGFYHTASLNINDTSAPKARSCERG